MSAESPKKLPRSPQEATKNFRAEILTIFLLLFWLKRWHQKDISKLTDLWMINFWSYDLQEGLLQYTNIQAMPSNIVTGKRIRLLYGNGANHWQKEKMINKLFINRSNPSTRFIINSVFVINTVMMSNVCS